MTRMHSITRLAVGLASMLPVVALAGAMIVGTVKGTVSRSGTPVGGAKVTIESQSDSAYSEVAYTDQAGAFSFFGTPLGGVIVKVYDGQGALLATGRGVLEHDGEEITLQFEVAP